jgi:MFS family permease
MTNQERQGWFIVASLFITVLLLVGGGYDTTTVFIPALIKHFGWSRARVSMLPSMLAITFGLGSPLFGMLVDRVEARFVIIAGAMASGAAYLLVSQMNSFAPMLAAYLLLGAGISAGSLVAGSFVITNWFTRRRGLALGIFTAGTTAGAMLMTLVANFAISHSGWRAAYIVLGIPMIAVVVPLVLLTVRSRPPGEVKLSVAQAADVLEGFETGAALRTRSFWLIAFAQFCFILCGTGAVLHLVAYLIDLGYKSGSAALAVSAAFGFSSIGKILMGLIADRVTGRIALGVNFIAQAFSLFLALYVIHTEVLVMFVVLFGLTVGSALGLVPMMIAESLGVRRFGSISGLVSLANTLGAAIGPVAAGWIHDFTGSYTDAFEIFIVLNILGCLACFACRSYDSERQQVSHAPAPASPASDHHLQA